MLVLASAFVTPLMIRRASLGWIDVVLVWSLSAHECLAAKVHRRDCQEVCRTTRVGQREVTPYLARMAFTLSSGIASTVRPFDVVVVA